MGRDGCATTLRTFRGELVDYIDPEVAPTDAARAMPDPGKRDGASATVLAAFLGPGARIQVIAPAGPFDAAAFERGVARLRARYDVRFEPEIVSRHGYLAGDDAAVWASSRPLWPRPTSTPSSPLAAATASRASCR